MKIILFIFILSVSAIAGTKVKLDTSKGSIVLELNDKKAPVTVKNFLKYVKSGHYNGTVFHRVIDGFMIQAGGFDEKMKKKDTKKPIKNEADNGLSNNNGTIAMARTSDPHSASAQFFINVKDNQHLDHRGKNQRGWGYAVFGKVVKGMSVVNAIKKTKTSKKGPMSDVPVETIVIKKASIL
jgi:cyclophilin family peptidyl-prolyl cis-trans isomerase